MKTRTAGVAVGVGIVVGEGVGVLDVEDAGDAVEL